MAIQPNRYNFRIADGETTDAFTIRGNDAVLGPSEFSVAVSKINGHTLTLQRYSEFEELWHSTGDSITTLAENAYKSVVGTKYRVSCSGGTGDATVEVAA